MRDYDETLRSCSGPPRLHGASPYSPYLDWMQLLMPCVKSRGAFGARPPLPTNSAGTYQNTYTPTTAAPHDYYLGYGLNYWMTHFYQYNLGKMSDITKPADTIWLTDSNYYLVYPTYYLAAAPGMRRMAPTAMRACKIGTWTA